jgi:hypothetical protein
VRHHLLRFVVVAAAIATSAAYFPTREPVRGIELQSRLLTSAPLPTGTTESCTWDVAKAEYQRAAYGTIANGQASVADRDEVLVPNCVAPPRIAASSTAADPGAMDATAYDAIHDEIVVRSSMGQAVLTYRGGARGDEAPIRIIQGPKTRLRDAVSLFIDPVHNEIFVVNVGTDDTMLVYDRTAQGDVAPTRVLKTPAAINGAGAVDPVSNLIFLNARNGGIMVFDRTAQGTTPPLRTIGGGPVSGLHGPGRIVVYPPTRSVVVTGSEASGARDRNIADVAASYIAVWSEDDNGDVPPRYTLARGLLSMPHALALDSKKKTVIVSDTYKNSVMTFSLPELYDRPATSQAARNH